MEKEHGRKPDRSLEEKDSNQRRVSERDNVCRVIDREIRELDAKLSLLRSDDVRTKDTEIKNISTYHATATEKYTTYQD